jgi:hypothetical protein
MIIYIKYSHSLLTNINEILKYYYYDKIGCYRILWIKKFSAVK